MRAALWGVRADVAHDRDVRRDHGPDPRQHAGAALDLTAEALPSDRKRPAEITAISSPGWLDMKGMSRRPGMADPVDTARVKSSMVSRPTARVSGWPRATMARESPPAPCPPGLVRDAGQTERRRR
jgi:hypothetical protein